jgi:hypothetical protein
MSDESIGASIVREPQTIELDCAPGGTRPGHLIGGVIEGLDLEPREPVSKVFGQWTWDYSDVPPERWDAIRPTLRDRITALYEAGSIRFGGW